MIRFVLLPCVLGLAACADMPAMPDFRDTGATAPVTPAAAPVPTVQMSDKERLVAAIEANDCIVNSANIGTILTRASINQSQFTTLSLELTEEGALSPDGDNTVRLSSTNCI